jgi:type I restriction enzyme, S subunit
VSFPRYPKYKDSGVEWLGEVPEHWEVGPVKYLAAIVNGYPFDSKLFDSNGRYPLVRIRDLGSAGTEAYYNGDFVESAAITSADVLIGMDGDFNVGRWLGEGRALLNQRMCCVRGATELLTRLLEYSLPIPLRAINEITYSTTVKHLSSSQVEKTTVAVPPQPSEQLHLLSFLDHEAAKIDALIVEQQRLIELLKEKRQAVISHAVTKGLNSDAPMKASGVEWLGDVPAHWQIVPLGRVTQTACDGPFGSSLKSQHYTDRGVRVVRLQNIRAGEFSGTDQAFIDPGYYAAELSRHDVRGGDLLVAGLGDDNNTVGRACVAPAGIEPAMVKADCFRFRLHTRQALPDFVSMQLTAGARADAGALSSGSTRSRIPLSVMSTRRLALPCPDEQKQIVGSVQSQVSAFEVLLAEAERAICLLQERRSALISAAVTGKIDVRGLVGAEAA